MANRKRSHHLMVMLNDEELALFKQLFEARKQQAEVLGAPAFTHRQFIVELLLNQRDRDRKDEP